MSTTTERCVIVGGGQAGAQAAVALRQRGFEGAIALVGDEPHHPYQRPPLSKAFLGGTAPRERLLFRPAALYERLAIDVHVATPVAEIDRRGRRAILADDRVLPYDRLVLATGARPRRLAVPGADLPQVTALRTVDEAGRIAAWLKPGARIAIVGGGYIGLEVAAVAASAGAAVTVLEAADALLTRVTGRAVSEFFAATHRARGVRILLGAAVHEIAAGPAGAVSVRFDDASIEADGVVCAVGVVPNVELAEAAGLPCDNGIVVDEHGRTADPAVLAAGDCTNHPNDRLGVRLRLESVHNAVEQAKTVAATICGDPHSYAQVPWFWSDQYEHKLQTVGLFAGHDRAVVCGSPDDGAFAVFYLRGDDVLAVDTVDMPRQFAHARAVFAAGRGRELPDLEAVTLASLPRSA